MLKVVGASWLQTRISTYILVAVALMGIGAIVFGEFGRVDNDGTYAATVNWNYKGGYRIDFWGQGNDLSALPRRAARAYYRTKIYESGWSIVEIETSPNYPDTVQAYAAGLLEGSLTWQLIHQHWRNTIATPCEGREEICDDIRDKLKDNAAKTRSKADSLAGEDPFWHMIRIFYAQLDGLAAGWQFAVKRSKSPDAEIPKEDFIWLAMASDIANFGPQDLPTSERDFNTDAGGILIKYVNNSEEIDNLIGIIHSTAAPYQKMLRLLKKYTFGYHMSSAKSSERVPTRSIIASSYPGALSSQDEYYILQGKGARNVMVVAGTPLATTKISKETEKGEIIISEKSESHTVMSAARIMSSNWLASSAMSWGQLLARRNAPEDISRPIQWIITRIEDESIWIIEQHSTAIHAYDYTNIFKLKKSLFSNGKSFFQQPERDLSMNRDDITVPITKKIEHSEEMGESSHEEKSMEYKINSTLNTKLIEDIPGAQWAMSYRGDLEKNAIPFGNIDTKVVLIDFNGIEKFEATSGPFSGRFGKIFQWSRDFPTIPHEGQPDKFNFNAVSPDWAWI